MRFSTLPDRSLNLPEIFMSPEDLRRRCAAAAQLSMRGANYGPEDRQDCAAMIAAEVLTTARQHGTPRDVLRFVDWCETHTATVFCLMAEDTAALPRSVASFSRLYGMAQNYRRSLDRQRVRDAEDAARRAASDGFTPHVASEDPALRSTPHAARQTAVDMLRNLGMLDGGTVHTDAQLWTLPKLHAHGTPRDVLRYIDRCDRILSGRAWPIQWGDFLRDTPRLKTAPRATAPVGPVWTAAYAAARAAAGLDAAEIAEELDITYGTLRNHLSAAAGKIPSVGTLPQSAHAEAVCAPEPVARKATATRAAAAGLENDWRTRVDAAPIECRTEDPALPDTPPNWTLSLTPQSAERMAHAKRIQRARAAAKTDAQRATDRLSAGLPGTVR